MKTLAALLAVALTSATAADWSRYMGDQSDGIWRESGIREDLPESGAKIAWRIPIAWGYSGPAVADGMVFLADYERTAGKLENNPGKASLWEGKERLHGIDATTGTIKWTYSAERIYNVSYPGGPRATPTVAGGLVYLLGTMGNLVVLDAKTGDLKWEKDFQKEFGAPLPSWGFAAHPLVKDGIVYCVAGGEGSVAVAFDAKTGDLKWKSLSAEIQGYCPPSIIKAGGTEQLIIWHPEAINGLNPASGETYWSLPLKPNYGMSVMLPQFSNNQLFASGVGRIGAMIQLGASSPTAEFGWRGKPKTALYCCNSNPIIVDGVIYGNDIDSSKVMAASLETGERYWESLKPVDPEDTLNGGRHGTAFLTYNEPNKQFWITNERGDLILAKLTKDGYQEIGRQHILEPTNEAFGRDVVWSPPAFAEKAVFLRNDKELVRVNLGE